MACATVRLPLLRNPAVRHYAAAAAVQPSGAAGPETQVLSNKVTAVAIDNNSPLTQLCVIFRAGSRNETYETQGIAHHLRIAAGLSSRRSTGFGITRNIQQLGGNLTATLDRETIAYTLQITRNNLNLALKFLEDVTTQQVFKPWEVSDNLPRLRYELSTIPEYTRVLDMLHKAAYRHGLGFSLYSPKWQIGRIGTETLQHFVSTWFTGPRCAVIGYGVPLSEVSAFAGNLNVPSEDKNHEPAKYYGGEIRKDRASPLATVAVAVEAVGLDKEKDALAYAVLQRLGGTGPRVKWGSTSGSLQRSVASAAKSEPFMITTVNTSYSDSGLFGWILTTTPEVAGDITKAAYRWLRTPKITDADVARAKAELKADILYNIDNTNLLVESLGQQAVLKGGLAPSISLANDVDKISAADIQSVATKCSSGKVSLAGIGDLRSVPFADQLN